MYDILIIGAGPGGYVAAIKAAQLGAKVAIVEKEAVGGVCLNHGCIPTKTLLRSAKVYKTVQKSKQFGITVDGTVSYNWADILSRKNNVVKQLTGGVAFLLKKNGVDVINGFAEAKSPTEVVVDGKSYKTKNLVVATGSEAFVPPIPGVDESFKKGITMTSRELLNIKDAPKSLVIVGGGVIGVEFATVFSSLGTKVTIIERMSSILPMIDEEVRNTYHKLLVKDGIEIVVDANVEKIDGKKLTYKKDGKDITVEGDTILLSVGTKPILKGIEKLNLKVERGAVVTDEFLRTNVNGVYAIGDVNGKQMLAHTASHEGIVAVEHILGKNPRPMSYDRIPSAIYGSPEIASIGLTEQQAKDKKLNYKVSTFPLAGNGKALADNEKDGFIKMIVDETYKEVIGVHILAYNATDMIAEIGVTMELEGTAYELARTIHPHPTLSEIVHEAALGAILKPIHI